MQFCYGWWCMFVVPLADSHHAKDKTVNGWQLNTRPYNAVLVYGAWRMMVVQFADSHQTKDKGVNG